tara:strand:+ start:182 stop:883 length:702 start_codon:yes stop_codon:yes gene_type:complete
MPVIPPKTLKVLANQEFKDLIFGLCEEIAHLSKLSSDLERVRSIINTNSAKKSVSNMGFFKITDPPSGNFETAKRIISSEDSNLEIEGHIYEGKFFKLTPFVEGDDKPDGYVPFRGAGGEEMEKDPRVVISQATDMVGVDLWSKQNDPTIIPEQAQIINARLLSIGTYVMAQKLGENLCAFTSCNPRLNVDCFNTEGVTLAGQTSAMSVEEFERNLSIQQARLDAFRAESDEY